MRTTSLNARAVEYALKDQRDRRLRERYVTDPVLWAKDMLGEEEGTLWSQQRDVAMSVVNNNSTAVKAGHGVGKTRLVAVLICWWVDTRFPDCYVVSTAPSTAQISGAVWREIRHLRDVIAARYEKGLVDHKLPGKIGGDDVWKDPISGVKLGEGRKPPDNLGGNSFQGIHGTVLAIGDEACALSGELIDALGNITTNDTSRRVLIANPTEPASYFASIFKKEMKNWSRMTISVLNSPNFTGEPMPALARKNLTTPQFVEQKKLEYGENSARFRSRVLGEFANDNESNLISPEDVAAAVATEIDDNVRPTLGVDVARYGADRTVVYCNTAGRVRFLDSWGKLDLVESAERVNRLALGSGAATVAVDCDGNGGGLFDVLMHLPERGYSLVEVHGGSSSPDFHRWHNFRAYVWDMFGKRCRDGLIDLDHEDIDLHDELQSVSYKFNDATGGLVLESKTDLKKRIGKSPDLADAAIYSTITNLDIESVAPDGKEYEHPDDIIGELPDYLEEMSNDFGLGWL